MKKLRSKSGIVRRSHVEQMEGRTLLSSVVVNTTLDQTDAVGSGTISLRDAVAIANQSTTPTTIIFDPTIFATQQTIVLGGTQLELTNTTNSTTISGSAAGVVVSGNDVSRVFEIDSSVVATFSNLTITGGNTVNAPNSIADAGGGIQNYGTLMMSDSTLAQNDASHYGGGGLDNEGFTTFENVTVADNATIGGGGGGGIINRSIMNLINVTVDRNASSSTEFGGGGVLQEGSGAFSDVTIYDNTADADGGGICCNDGITGTVSLSNSIVAGNTASAGNPDVSGSIASKGFNLISAADGSSGWLGTDFIGSTSKPIDPALGSLANNGGLTQTLLPLPGSPAINHGSNSLVPSGITTDERGQPRIFDGTVDIGAVEVQSVSQGNGLTPTVPKSTVPTHIIGGAKAHGIVTISLQNVSGIVEKGLASAFVYASIDGEIDASAILIGSHSQKVSVKINISIHINIAVKITSLPPWLK